MKKSQIKIIHSVFAKILFVSIMCMVIPMLVSLIYIDYSSSNYIEGQTKASLQDTANEKAQQINATFNDILNYVKSIANEPYAIDFFKEASSTNQLDPIKQKRLAENLTQKFNDVNGLYENIFYIQNRVVLSDGIGGKSLGYKITDAEVWYDNALKSNLYIGDPLISPISGRPVIVAASTSIDESSKKNVGVFGLPIDLINLTQNLIKSDSNKSAKTILIDSTGNVISSEIPSRFLN